ESATRVDTLNNLVFCALTSINGFCPFVMVGRPRGLMRVISENKVELLASPTKMQLSFIQHSTIDPEKSTTMLEARIETRAKALNSPGGTMTFPACRAPAGFIGVKPVASGASCKASGALPFTSPAACALAVVHL